MTFSVIIHYPKGKEAEKKKKKKVADVHAQTVIEMIRAMSLPAEEKVRLIHAVKNYILK